MESMLGLGKGEYKQKYFQHSKIYCDAEHFCFQKKCHEFLVLADAKISLKFIISHPFPQGTQGSTPPCPCPLSYLTLCEVGSA